jgi:hypothetical protein
MADLVRTLPLDVKPRSDRSDPVIEAYKADVDRTLLRESLKKTPEQRIEDLQRLHDFASELQRAGRRLRGA